VLPAAFPLTGEPLFAFVHFVWSIYGWLPPTDRIVFSAQKREPPKGLTRTRRQPQIRPPRCQPQIRPPPAATTAPASLRLRCSPPFPARSHCPCLIPGLPDRARQAWNQSEPSSRQAAGGWRKRQAREQQKAVARAWMRALPGRNPYFVVGADL
jgi:hypothetical protein